MAITVSTNQLASPCTTSWWREVPLYVSRVARAFIEVGVFRVPKQNGGKSWISPRETMENSGFKHERWEF